MPVIGRLQTHFDIMVTANDKAFSNTKKEEG